MSSSFPRSLSPATRPPGQAGRIPAGSLVNPSHPDYYQMVTSRPAREHVSLPRGTAGRGDHARAISVRHRSPPRMIRDDDYLARPQRISLGPTDSGARRPLSLIASRSPNRNGRPIITKGLDRPASPIPKASSSKHDGVQLEASYIIPASGRHHYRHPSLNSSNRWQDLDRNTRSQVYTGGSRSSTSRQFSVRERPDDTNDREYNSEYTGPKKEVIRDPGLSSYARPRDRRASIDVGRDRPSSIILPDNQEAEYRRMTREMGPPLISRGLDHPDRSEPLNVARNHRDLKPERRGLHTRGHPKDAHEATRYLGPQSHYKTRDDGYISYPDENSRDMRPRKPAVEEDPDRIRPRSRKLVPENDQLESRPQDNDRQHARDGQERPRRYRDLERRTESVEREIADCKGRDEPRDKRGLGTQDAIGSNWVAGGAATLTAVAINVDSTRRQRRKEEDVQVVKEPRLHLRDFEREQKDPEGTSISDETRMSGAVGEEGREEHYRRRRLERGRDGDRHQEKAIHDTRITKAEIPISNLGQIEVNSHSMAGLRPQKSESLLREQNSFERRPESEKSPSRADHGYRIRYRSQSRDANSSSGASSVSGDAIDSGERSMLRVPRVVEPSLEADTTAMPTPLPKGILKKARDKFPEPVNPVREGVAPLDAAKKGIPPEARWTRINRRLVNPEALESEGVRFEEFPDHVIVLKVLNQEEITKYAQKTHEIREKRRVMIGQAEGPGLTSEPT